MRCLPAESPFVGRYPRPGTAAPSRFGVSLHGTGGDAHPRDELTDEAGGHLRLLGHRLITLGRSRVTATRATRGQPEAQGLLLLEGPQRNPETGLECRALFVEQ